MLPDTCYFKYILIFIILNIPLCNGYAQLIFSGKQTDTLKDMFSIGAGIQHGFIFAHSPEVENTKGANPTGVELIFSWQRNDAYVWDLCNCFPRKGLLLAYYDYDNIILDKSFMAAYFLEPTYSVGKKTLFSLKGTAGLSYLTNPFDTLKNPANRSYSTKLSAYLSLGVGVWFRLDRHWWLNASANFNHESNGGLRQPNKGINWPTAGIALSYQHKSRLYYSGMHSIEAFRINPSIRYDIGIFGIAKRALDENGNSRRLPLIGLSLQGSKQVGRINAITAGIEVFRDATLDSRLKNDSVNASPLRAGILAGHEFVLGKFLLSQRLGVYVFDQTPYFDQLYHRWSIHYRINSRIGAGVNLLAHRHIADFTDIKFTYSMQRK